MISFSHNKKIILGVVLLFTLILLVVFLILNIKPRLHKYIVSDSKWNTIITDREESASLTLNTILFNDYSLIIDPSDNTIYYSFVDQSKKYDPLISYTASSKVKLAIKEKITKDNQELELVIYNDQYYHIYTLIVTDLPMIDVTTSDSNDVSLYIFDNHIDAIQRVVKTKGKFRTISEGEKYSLSLIKESLGHNKRDNELSLFGMSKSHEYILNHDSNSEKMTLLFVNDEYLGVFSIQGRERRDVIHE